MVSHASLAQAVAAQGRRLLPFLTRGCASKAVSHTNEKPGHSHAHATSAAAASSKLVKPRVSEAEMIRSLGTHIWPSGPDTFGHKVLVVSSLGLLLGSKLVTISVSDSMRTPRDAPSWLLWPPSVSVLL